MKSCLVAIFLILVLVSCENTPKKVPRNQVAIDSAVNWYKRGDTSYYQYKYEQAIQHYQQGLIHAEQTDSLNLLSNLNNDIGLCYKKLGMYDSAIKYYQIAEQIDLNRNDTTSLAGRWRNMGNVYESQGWHTEAIALYLKAVNLLTPNYQQKIAPLHLAIGNIFLDQGEYDEAINYYQMALPVYIQRQSELRQASVTNNLGMAYLRLNQLDSAHHYLTRSLGVKIRVDSSSLPYTLNMLGELFIQKRNFDSALYYFDQSSQVIDVLDDGYLRANNSYHRAKLAIATDQLDLAKSLILESVSYAERQQIGELMVWSYEILAEIHLKTSEYDRAYGFLKQWSELRDSIFLAGKLQTERIISNYELDKKEEQRIRANIQAERSQANARRSFWIAGVAVIALLFFALLSWIIYRQRQRMQSLNTDLQESNQQIDTLNRQNFHFTVNSLAGIISILNGQLSQYKGSKAYDVLVEEKLRMESISILYNKLFKSEEGQYVAVADFIRDIVINTFDTMGISSDRLQLNLEEHQFANQKAFTLGLIVNEISLNAAKYGMANNGVFFVNFSGTNNKHSLVMRDEGPGLPESVQWTESSSFGIRLIRILCEQLNAEVIIDSELGLSYHITF